MTCKELGGACDKAFAGEIFEDISQKSMKHGMDMYAKGDAAHTEAMNKMKELMKDAQAMRQWYESKRKEFDAL